MGSVHAFGHWCLTGSASADSLAPVPSRIVTTIAAVLAVALLAACGASGQPEGQQASSQEEACGVLAHVAPRGTYKRCEHPAVGQAEEQVETAREEEHSREHPALAAAEAKEREAKEQEASKSAEGG
jgi:uncharacterized lipoprotein